VGKTVTLVPYKKEHVENYHEWMKSPEILELTCSEPLSLEEECAMQESWHVDENSICVALILELTFILLDNTYRVDGDMTGDMIQGMCGDVNLFLQEDNIGEIEVMVAEQRSRRKGIAFEALQIFLGWIKSNLPVTTIVAKIVEGNQSSIDLFKKLGFVEVKFNKIFREHVMEYTLLKE
jgi:RimJ/RimL family protein N-acetyltransferase